MSGAKKPWHLGDYPRRAQAIRDAANNDPTTTCWRCGTTARPGDPWQAGHTVDSSSAHALAPEHRSCNARAGQATRYQPTPEPRSPQW